MAYMTTDEIQNFDFQEADLTEISLDRGRLVLKLGYVTILPENSCNRDIRKMGTNELVFEIQNAEILRLVEEGYQVYDADGNLKQTCDDREIEPAEYGQAFEKLAGGAIYSLRRKETDSRAGREYEICIDTEGEEQGRTYLLLARGEHDLQQWERFMNREASY